MFLDFGCKEGLINFLAGRGLRVLNRWDEEGVKSFVHRLGMKSSNTLLKDLG